MEQELNLISKLPKTTPKVAIIGAGPSGCMCAYYLQNDFDVTIFDLGSPLRTLLPTGGGRCNLAFAEFDFKELAKNYPRGEKFLYSVFSKFSTAETIEFFKNIGVETYTQDDGRIFPTSNSSKDVREKFLKSLKHVKFVREVVSELDFKHFDYIVIATGGHSSYSLAKGHKIIPPKPALVGLKTTEKFPAGVTVKNVGLAYLPNNNVYCKGITGDLLFTHEGISGPLIYKISSIKARDEFPYDLELNFCEEFDLQEFLNKNSQKSIVNLLSEFVPKSLAEVICDKAQIKYAVKCHKINGEMRNRIYELLHAYPVRVVGTVGSDVNHSGRGETVTCGGIDLNEVNPKTMESKIVKNLYFCGEVLDIDGFCGGFNLQNCWSTGYLAAQGIIRVEWLNS